MVKRIQPQPIDRELLTSARCGQGCKPKRCSCDRARRAWYGRHRTERLARLGGE